MAVACGLVAENGRHVVVGLARVDHRRLPRPGRDRELGLERQALALAGRVVVMVVEAHLPGGHHPGSPEPLAQPLGGGRAPAFRIMGVHAGGGREAGLLGGEGQSPIGRLGRFSNHHDMGQSRLPCSLENIRAVGIVGRVGQVAVGVDQHRGGPGRRRYLIRPAAACGCRKAWTRAWVPDGPWRPGRASASRSPGALATR